MLPRVFALLLSLLAPGFQVGELSFHPSAGIQHDLLKPSLAPTPGPCRCDGTKQEDAVHAGAPSYHLGLNR